MRPCRPAAAGDVLRHHQPGGADHLLEVQQEPVEIYVRQGGGQAADYQYTIIITRESKMERLSIAGLDEYSA